MDIANILKRYDRKKITIAVLGSHSALDVCRGAKDEGFSTLVVAQKGRSSVYSNNYFSKDGLGCVDEVIELDKFSELLDPKIQEKLIKKNCIFIPHRSFEVYINNYPAIENDFKVPMFGNRYLLKIEERGVTPNQYDLLKTAKIRTPHIFEDPKKINRLCIVKILEQERGFERSFFTVSNYKEYQAQVKERLKRGDFSKEQLKKAVIEEFLVGVQVNLNFFYSLLSKRVELLGTDTRRQTNLEGFSKIPGLDISQVLKKLSIKYEEAGHMAVTVLESMLGDIFEMGERFVTATQKVVSPGVIGPFGLQCMIIPGPPKKELVVFDVSPRMPGSPGIFATPYSGYLFGEHISVGKRVALEIKKALKENKLAEILT
jgi:5-formaminoimidazole-4-carboxamide-1-(beta)-D-ribofuranosyl 5'-monophosphate synthetase